MRKLCFPPGASVQVRLFVPGFRRALSEYGLPQREEAESKKAAKARVREKVGIKKLLESSRRVRGGSPGSPSSCRANRLAAVQGAAAGTSPPIRAASAAPHNSAGPRRTRAAAAGAQRERAEAVRTGPWVPLLAT